MKMCKNFQYAMEYPFDTQQSRITNRMHNWTPGLDKSMTPVIAWLCKANPNHNFPTWSQHLVH